jgi:hypothetical protein
MSQALGTVWSVPAMLSVPVVLPVLSLKEPTKLSVSFVVG